MLTKLFAGLVVAVGLGVSALAGAGTAPVLSSDCCAPGADCCYPGSPCCESWDCCAPGAECCFPGSPCCASNAAAAVKSDEPTCCEPGAPCCDGGACCAAK